MRASAILYLAVSAMATNLNGDYAVSSVADIDTEFNSDYASKGYEYFDVWVRLGHWQSNSTGLTSLYPQGTRDRHPLWRSLLD
jgi:hypothetical protein